MKSRKLKRIGRKRSGFFAVVLVLGMVSLLSAGDLTPPAGPDSDGSAMFTVEDLYQRLLNGTAGTKRNGVFQEPYSGPTSGTMHTFNDVMNLAPQTDNTNGAQDVCVLTGKHYWGLTGSQWGLRTGSMANIGTQNVTPGTFDVTITQGYHSGSGKVSGDTDLVTGNVRAGVNIFGVTGNSNVVNTSSGDASGATIKFGKKAWVDGIEITGFLAGGTFCNPEATYSPMKRWVNNGNGTITDTTTGLIWYHRGNAFWGAYEVHDAIPCPPAAISKMSNSNPGDLTDGSAEFAWRIPTVNEMLKITSGVEAISPGTQYLFTGIQTAWYWTSSMSTNPNPMKFMTVQMPENNGFGTAENVAALHYAMAVRNP